MPAILVDQDLCTRCGICSAVCAMGVIDSADENTLPRVNKARAISCIHCGHCEAHCPTQALLFNERPDEKVRLPASTGDIIAGDLGYYLRKRRSVRHFTRDPVSKEKILELLDIARYAPSGGNGQPVEWIVVEDRKKVHRIAELTIEWMKTLTESNHPMGRYVPTLIREWEHGHDVICRDAPHLLFAHIPGDRPIAPVVDAIIALTHFDIAAPAFGIGTCWAGFVAGAAREYQPLKDYLGIPEGRIPAYAMMFGNPQYKIYGIPRRKPLKVTWQ